MAGDTSRVEQLRAALSKHRARKRHGKYPDELRTRAIAYNSERRRAGASITELAAELGVQDATASAWSSSSAVESKTVWSMPAFWRTILVGRLDYHTPYYRQEVKAARMGYPVCRTSMARWQFEAAAVARRITNAMWHEALARSWIGMDATGTAIQDEPE